MRTYTLVREQDEVIMKYCIVTFLLLSVCCCCGVEAQVVGDSIAEVTVVGKRGNEVASAATVHSLNMGDMMQRGVTDIADAIHRLPGITLRDYGGAGGVKTVSVRGFGSQHTGVSYDGIMLSDCQTGEIDLHRYTLDNMKSLSLAVGDKDEIFVPARAISTAATLNIETEKREGLLCKLSYGSWNQVNPMISYGKRMGRLFLSANADYLHADNDYPFTLYNIGTRTREHRANSAMDQGHGEVDLRWLASEKAQIDAKIYYYDNDRELPGVVHYYTDENDENLRERNMFVQLGGRFRLADRLSLRANGKWNWASTDYHNGMPSGGVTSAEYWQREYYGNACLLYTPVEALALDYSIDYFVNNINSSLAQMASADRKSLLQSASAKLRLDRLTLIGRAIWSNYMGEAHRLSPSVSMSFRLAKDKEYYLRMSYKSIFRMPTFKELYYFHLGDQALKPENTNQVNLGLTASERVGKTHLSATVDAYYNRVSDKIVSVPINMFVWRNINMARVDALGLDFSGEISYNINKVQSLALYANYSLQRVKNMTDSESTHYENQIAYTPEHVGSATLSWQNPWVNLSVTGDGMTERWTTNEHSDGTRMPGYMEFSATAYRTFALRNSEITLRASMMNLFDKQYDVVAHYPMPGRSWKISLTFKY